MTEESLSAYEMALRDGTAIVERQYSPNGEVTQTPYSQEEVYLALRSDFQKLFKLEIGTIDAFTIIDDLGPAPELQACHFRTVPKAEPITYGPARKGHGGKIRRW